LEFFSLAGLAAFSTLGAVTLTTSILILLPLLLLALATAGLEDLVVSFKALACFWIDF